jgi:ABC-type tungstate transport system permease subunit
MTTIILDTRSTEAKKMLEFLKSTRYAKVIEEEKVNNETLSAINDIENGKVNSYNSVNDLMLSLKKKASV